jgi:hypothetical protein
MASRAGRNDGGLLDVVQWSALRNERKPPVRRSESTNAERTRKSKQSLSRSTRDPVCWARADPGPACWVHGASGSARASGSADASACAAAGAWVVAGGCAGDEEPLVSWNERRAWSGSGGLVHAPSDGPVRERGPSVGSSSFGREGPAQRREAKGRSRVGRLRPTEEETTSRLLSSAAGQKRSPLACSSSSEKQGRVTPASRRGAGPPRSCR